MKLIFQRGVILVDSIFGVAMLSLLIASIALALPHLKTAIESASNEDVLTERLAKQRLEEQLSAYRKFANTM